MGLGEAGFQANTSPPTLKNTSQLTPLFLDYIKRSEYNLIALEGCFLILMN